MRKFLDKFFAGILVVILMITSLYMEPTKSYAYAKEKTSEYEIYPNPQEISYQDGTYVIRSQVNAVMEEGIDEATQNRLKEVVDSKGKTMTVSDAKAEKKTNILVGIYGSGGYVDRHVQENYEIDESLFSHYGSHYVISNNDEICIVGKDTDAAFYGLTSLKHIFNQMDGSTIRNFTIKDYADTNIRGFIEGYYGIPWSNADRMSLMKFGGEFKMTSYVFAPKNDPYHREKWRELYPEEELEAIKEMVAVGNASKCRFVWTAHPFMGGFHANKAEEEIAFLLAKFDQLYEAGVRQFGVLGDDVGSLNRQVVIQVMNAVSEWAKAKGDVYDSVFCPAGYNDSWQDGAYGDNYNELSDYDAGFPEDIKIFWTGQAVCQPVEQKTLDNFRTKKLPEGRTERRSPLFWLNWPVNDVNMNRLMMGKGSLLHTDIDVNDLAGVVTNPMQDAEASKVAIFAVADYSWNVADFNADKSWEDSFPYVDADAAESLHTLAKHMSDPAPNGHGLTLAESEELKPLLDEFMTAYEAGNLEKEKARNLIKEFEVIIKACADFHALSKNEKMKEELLPFTNSLRDLSQANILLIKTAIALEEGNAGEVWSNYSQAAAKLSSAKNDYKRPTLDAGLKNALPGSKWISPFADQLNSLLAVPVNSLIDDSKLITTFITNRTDTPNGTLEKLTDNKEGTEVIWKSPNSTTAGTYIGLIYSKEITLNDVTFKMGQAGNERDTFQNAKIQYTADGKTWIDLEGSDYTDRRATVTVEGLNLQIKGIRLISTADQENMWLGCKDIIVNKDSQTKPEEPGTIAGTGIYNTENMVIRNGNVGMMTDGAAVDKSSNNYAGFSKSNSSDDPDKDKTVAGAWVGIEFAEPTEVSSILVSQGTGDHIKTGSLEYTVDGSSWTKIADYTDIGSDFEQVFEPVTAKAIRLVNGRKESIWWRIYEITASAPKNEGVTEYTYTNVKALEKMTAVHTEAETYLNAKSGITLKSGEYIGLKLERIKDITNIKTDRVAGLTLQTSKNGIVWTDVADTYEDARYIRLMNQSDKEVTFDLTTFAAESYEISPISVLDKNVSYYDGGDGMKGFDHDRTSEVIFLHSQIQGDFITYDLGQTIDLNSITLVSRDSATDFPRHAKISVSTDNKNWREVLTIGNQDSANPGEAEGTDTIMDVLPIHDVSFNLKEAEGLEEEARYIKFEITRTKVGPDKWTRYTEIELNGGNLFLPTQNDPTITTDAAESEGNEKGNMIDGDVSTTFKPVGDQAGSFTYFISEGTDFNKLSILQSPSSLSKAKVTAEVIKEENGAPEKVVLGNLNGSLNEFNTSLFAQVLSVNVEWTKGNVPEIHEIITSATEVKAVNKDALQKYYNDNNKVNTDKWTDASKKAYADALSNAGEVLENEYTTQAMADGALASLKKAVEEKEELGDFAAFETTVKNLKKDVLAEENYLARTWKVYKERLEAAEKAITDQKLSQAEVDELLEKLRAAKDGLVYEVNSIEQLELALKEAKELKKEDYSKATFEKLQEMLTEAEAMLQADKAERQNPGQVKEGLSKLEGVIDNLVYLGDLKKKIAEAEAMDTSGYTESTKAALKSAIEDAKAAVNNDNATRKDITDVYQALVRAIDGLAGISFPDVSEGDWFYNEVQFVNKNGIMTGLGNGDFGPYVELSRAHFVVMLYRLEGTPEADQEINYPDVTKGEWYTDAVKWATKNNIVTGYDNTGMFGIADAITREQMATMMCRYARYKGYDTTEKADFSKFEDGNRVSEFAKEAMEWVVGSGIIKGKFEGKQLDPQGNTSRAEAAIVMARFMNNLQEQ